MNSVSATAPITREEQFIIANNLRQTRRIAQQQQARSNFSSRRQARRQSSVQPAKSQNLTVGQERGQAKAEGKAARQEDLRQAQHLRRMLNKDDKADAKKSGVMNKLTSPFRRWSSRALIKYWQSLIQSGGATLLLIDLHVLGRYTAGENMFVKLGHEWSEYLAGKTGPGSSSAEIEESFGNKIGVIEATVVLLLNIAVLISIIIVLVNFMFVAAIFVAPLLSSLYILQWLAEQIF